MPPLHSSQLSWNNAGEPEGQHIIFELVTRNNKLNELAEMVVSNSFHEAEAGAFNLFPSILPIGPLFADPAFRKPVGHFLPEDERCIKWLDAQPDASVVYVAFGSITIFDARQFEELAEGLELTGRPFLWVVRPDFTPGLSKAWLHEFRDRVGGRGMIVSWCPQQQVHVPPSTPYLQRRPALHIVTVRRFLPLDRCWLTVRWRASCRTAGGTRPWRG
jgi:hypothetical protein